MNHRNKHRVRRSIYFLIVLIVLALLVFKISRYFGMDVALLLGFIIGLGCFVVYEYLMLPHMKKHKDLYINSSTQIYIGIVTIFSAVITLIQHVLFQIPLENELLLMSVITILFLLFTIKPFDQFLEKRGY